MNTYWPAAVPALTRTSTNDYKELNRPLAELAARTDFLKARMDELAAGECLSTPGVRLAAEAKEGYAMAYSGQRGLFAPARAAWSAESSASGAPLPGDVSVPAGILIRKHTDTSGDLVTAGSMPAFPHLYNLFGSASPAPGLYYLSATEPGRLTLDPPANPVLVALLTGDGLLTLLTGDPRGSAHEHVSLQLAGGGWLAAVPANFPAAAIPAGAAFGYDAYADGSVAEMTALYQGKAFLTRNDTGANVPADLFTLDSEGMWWLAPTPPGDMTVWLTRPAAAAAGAVRAIVSTTPGDLSVSVANGVALIGLAEGEAAYGVPGSTVVKGIDGRSVRFGDVVESIIGEGGISVAATVAGGKGTVTISGLEWAERLIDAVPPIPALGHCFQAGSPSTASFTAYTPKWSAGFKKLKFWMWVRGAPLGRFPVEGARVAYSIFYPPGHLGSDMPPGEYKNGAWNPRQALPNGSYESLENFVDIPGFSPCLNEKMYIMEAPQARWVDVGPECLVNFSITFGGVRPVFLHRVGISVMSA
jgi:hypothetical protein